MRASVTRGVVEAAAVVLVVVALRSVLESSAELSAAPDASFCFWSCSFCRLRCFLRNLARRFLNQTWQTDAQTGQGLSQWLQATQRGHRHAKANDCRFCVLNCLFQ